MFNKKEDFKSRVIPKTNEQKERMMKTITKSILFQSLEDQELHTVIDAFEEVNFGEKQFVITQGEQGEVLYLIETGQLSCFKKFSPNEEPKFLKHYYPGEYFGELALLHNAPRAASIQADIDCTMWALDRETFNHIVKDAAM
jgi:cAMP-dependent protein kinase regulator